MVEALAGDAESCVDVPKERGVLVVNEPHSVVVRGFRESCKGLVDSWNVRCVCVPAQHAIAENRVDMLLLQI